MKARHLVNKRTFLGLVMLAAVALMAAVSNGAALAHWSGAVIDWWVISGGGSSSSNSSVTLDGTLGQPVTGVSTDGSAWLGAGYWYADQPVQIFLPMLRR